MEESFYYKKTKTTTHLHLVAVLLTICLTPSVLHANVVSFDRLHLQEQEQSICVRAPGLQVLEEELHSFHCSVNENVHALNCSDRGIPALPRTGDTGVDQSIRIFDFSYNKIKCLPKINNTRPSCSVSDCSALGCLRELRLHHNEIDFLHQEAFLNLTCLELLDLSHNLLTNTTIQRHHFFRLSHLHELDLHGNPLHTLPNNVLIATHMSHLNTLNLSSCQLQRIGDVAIDDFFELEALDLSRNLLTRLSSRTFQGLVSLQVLDLRWNKLRVVDKDTFGDLRNLKELRLDYNELVSISELAFHRQASLESLSLVQNEFTAIPYSVVSTLKKLRVLNLSHNPINTLSYNPDMPIFPGEENDVNVTTSVRELRLDYLTPLERVEDGDLSAFPRLAKLSLRYCGRLRTLDPGAFRGCSAFLSEALLDHNALEELPEELLPWERLSWLTLHGNPWRCDCRLGWAAGHPVGNSSISCQEPLKLRGQTLQSLEAAELDCGRPILGFQVVMGMTLTLFFLSLLGLLLWRRSRRKFCWCLRGDLGRYVTVFTKDKPDSDDNDEGDLVNNGTTCGDGEVDDLDLGNGGRGGGGGEEGGDGRVTILMKTFRNGYRRLRNTRGREGEGEEGEEDGVYMEQLNSAFEV